MKERKWRTNAVLSSVVEASKFLVQRGAKRPLRNRSGPFGTASHQEPE
jgi:hypothetical protein